MLPKFITGLFALMVLYCIPACQSESEEVSPVYEQFRFDTAVINRLPTYDSLALVVINAFPAFRQYINENDSYRSCTYMPGSGEDVSAKLPQELTAGINSYFSELGGNYIYRFDVFKDSTIKIFIRRYRPDSTSVDLYEHLSYFPAGNIRPRQFPDKDTILGKRWQYWVQFSKGRFF